MKLSLLLHQREALLQQTRIANLAYAYRRLGDFAARISRARLSGKVCLQAADPGVERYWPALIALQGNQSVIEEHFSDENILELADLLVFITGANDADTLFHLEELDAEFIEPLRGQLVQAGVILEPDEAEGGVA